MQTPMSTLQRAALLVLLMLLAVPFAYAQEDETPESPEDSDTYYEVYGVIESVEAELLVISGVTYSTEIAEIEDEASLEAGDWVYVEYIVFGGENIALEVEVLEDGEVHEEEFTLQGAVEAIDEETITVGGLTFTTTRAEIETEDTLEVGEYVLVEYEIETTGTLTALYIEEIQAEDADEYFELEGVIEAFGEGATITISGVVFTTELVEVDTEDALTVGDLVRVEYVVMSGVNIALEIEDISDDETECEIEPEGWDSYEVRSGDTLSEIALATGTTVEELVRVNCFEGVTTIFVGQELLAPYVEWFFNRETGEDEDEHGDEDESGDEDDSGDEHDEGEEDESGDDDDEDEEEDEEDDDNEDDEDNEEEDDDNEDDEDDDE